MNKLFVMCVMMLLATSNVSADNKITLKDVTGKTFTPKYITGVDPIKGTDRYASISNDGRQIIEYAFKTGNQTRVLFDIANTHGESIKQLDGYTLSPDGKRMLIQTNTHKIYRRSFTADYYIYTIQSRKLEKLSTGGPQQIPTWSPDGNQIAFVRDNNIFLVKLLYDNAESQITKDGKFNEIINGVPDWVYEEEFSTNRSLCFTADSRMLCWIKYDERKVKEYSLQLFMGSHPTMKANEVYPGTYTYKYPKAGEDNSIVSVWSYEIQTHKTNRLQVPLEGDGYIPRIKSTNDANRIIVFTMNRHQDVLNLYAVNPRTTLSQLLIKEQGDKYVKEEAMEGITIGQNSILLPSDRDGYMHLYLYNMNGSLIRKIGDGNYDITSIYGYDETTGDVYYQASGINSHDRQIFVSHKNGKTERLTDTNGWNKAIFSGDYKYFLNTWSNYNTPYVFTIRDNKGKVLSTPIDNKELKEKVKTYGFNGRETFSFTTSEGVKLDGWMVKPKDFDTNKKYPVILFQYSGPGSQQVIDAWNAGSMGNGGAFDYYLAQQGFIVVCVDGRGTGGRGAAFEKCTYLRIGELESHDQIETALWLGKQSYIDKERIGIWGWSFGGFNTLMSTPKENGSGYATNPIQRANALHGALLICHGMADDNVQPQNTMEYTEALIQADKNFKENIYTNRNHGIYGGNTRIHLLRQISNWFIEHLK